MIPWEHGGNAGDESKHETDRGVRHPVQPRYALWNEFVFSIQVPTGYNQSVTGCGSQRKQCSCYSTKTNVNSNLICLRWETYTLEVVFVEHHTQICVYVSQRSQIQFGDEDRANYMSFCWVTTTCLRWEPQSMTLWLYPVVPVDINLYKKFLKQCIMWWKKHNYSVNNMLKTRGNL